VLPSLRNESNDDPDFTAFPALASISNEKSPENRGFFADMHKMPVFQGFSESF
jgi:hypothetical protein